MRFAVEVVWLILLARLQVGIVGPRSVDRFALWGLVGRVQGGRPPAGALEGKGAGGPAVRVSETLAKAWYGSGQRGRAVGLGAKRGLPFAV